MINVRYNVDSKLKFNLAIVKEKNFWLSLIAIILSLAMILEVIVVCIFRLSYPDSFDWVEGASADQVFRMMHGLYLYGAPSTSYISLMYPPLYEYVCAAFAFFFGDIFFTLRVVSLLSFLGVLYLVSRFVSRETGSITTGILAAGICASSSLYTSFYSNMARVDWLFCFLLLMSYYIVKFSKSNKSIIAGAGIFFLAAMTKQTALILIPMVSFALAFKDKKQALLFALTTTALCGITYFGVNHATDGWFFYYLFAVPASHEINLVSNTIFFQNELFGFYVISFVLSIHALSIWMRNGDKYNTAFYSLFLAGFFLISWAPRVKASGFVNNLFPLCIIISILGTIASQRLYRNRETRALASVFFLVMIVGRIYSPLGLIPDKLATKLAVEKVNGFRRLPHGRILAPTIMYLPIEAGRNSTAFWSAMLDVIFYQQNRATPKFLSMLYNEILQQKFSAIVLPVGFSNSNYFPYTALNRAYFKAGQINENGDYLNIYYPLLEHLEYNKKSRVLKGFLPDKSQKNR
jgi:hypothetical protein